MTESFGDRDVAQDHCEPSPTTVDAEFALLHLDNASGCICMVILSTSRFRVQPPGQTSAASRHARQSGVTAWRALCVFPSLDTAHLLTNDRVPTTSLLLSR
jgi:hypothetical protein